MTDQTSNDGGSRRLRREQERRRLAAEQGQARPEDPGTERSRRDDPSPDLNPVEQGRRDGGAPRMSPVERSWGADVTPQSPQSSPPAPRVPPLSRRELRERAAAGGSGAPPTVDDNRTTRRRAEPVEQDRPATSPAPAAPTERPLSRRELRERAATTSGESVASRPWREDTPAPESSGHDAPAGRRRALGQGDEALGRRDVPREEPLGRRATRRDARWDGAPRSEAPAPVSDWPEPGPMVTPTQRPEPGPMVTPTQRPDPGPTNASWFADVEAAEGPSRPVQPARASASAAAERVASQDESRGAAPQPGPGAENAPEPLVGAPTRISPQARAAAIRAQAARVQAEREDATRARYDQLDAGRAEAQQAGPQAGTPSPGAHTQPAGQPPETMWGRQESNGAPVPGAVADTAGYEDRPPVRRVVLPPTASTGASPTDVPVLGQWQTQPPQFQAAAPQQQAYPASAPQQQAYPAAPMQQQQYEAAAPTQQQFQVAAPPQQFQGIPSGGPMPANGQPFATVTMDRGTTQTATAPARPGGGPGGPPDVDGSGPLPRWGSVSPSGVWSSTPSYGPNGQAPVGPAPQAMVGTTSEAQPDDDDDDESVHRHPYTWLHMIVLVLVAFVLGMLIFMLVIKDTTEDGAVAAPERVAAASLERVTERVGD